MIKKRPAPNPLPTIRIAGYVKWFNDAKGFGFIAANGVDYFVHYSDIVGKGHRKLDAFQEVRFVPTNNLRGPRAREITPIDPQLQPRGNHVRPRKKVTRPIDKLLKD